MARTNDRDLLKLSGLEKSGSVRGGEDLPKVRRWPIEGPRIYQIKFNLRRESEAIF